MNRKKTLDRISELLARFVAEVQTLNKENLYDINIHAENVLVPIINKAYGLKVVNANRKEKNAAAIDLVDSTNRICFQVTSSSDSEKIKHTLRQFKKHKKFEFFDTLFIYIITQKQKTYSGKGYSEILDDTILFNKDEHIIDNTDLYSKISSSYSLPHISSIKELLESEFSEEKINERRSNASTRDIIKTDRVYSNLLELQFPPKLFIADLNIEREKIIEDSWETEYKLKKSSSNRKVTRRALGNLDRGYFRDWHVYEKKLISFRNFSIKEDPLNQLVDLGTIEEIGSNEFFEEGNKQEMVFLELLKYTFEEKMIKKGIKLNNEEGFYQYLPLKKSVKIPRTITWKIKKFATRKVVTPYFRDTKTKKKTISYLKHQAFSTSFKLIEGNWFVLVNPTWSYTRNGYDKSPFHSKNLKGIKGMENNAAVRNSVLAIACNLHFYLPKETNYPHLQVELPEWGELTYVIKELK